MGTTSYCETHQLYFFDRDGCRSCHTHARALELADRATVLAAESASLTFGVARELNTAAADLETSERIRHYIDTHQRVEKAFFEAMTGQPAHGLRVVR